jgi:para-nitrobenzyl esterase
VYQYGGQWKWGYSSKYEGSFLAGQDIVVVTINYRTGPMGFLAHPLLLNRNPENTTGMYGIQDQRAALQWVKDNIANFGGNPNWVTYGGQSAGGGTLCAQLASPRTAGLFQAAIMQSPSCAVLLTADEGFALGDKVVTKFGCNMTDPQEKLNCMLALNPEDLINDNQIGSGTMATPYEIMERPVKIFESGNFTPVPLFSGQCWNESAGSTCGPLGNLTVDQFYTLLQSNYPDNWQQYAEIYALSKFPTPVAAWIAILSDRNFKCTTKAVLDAYSAQSPSVWVYSFEQPVSDPGQVAGTSQCLGTAHGFDTYYLFPSYIAAFGGSFTDAEKAFTLKAREVWVGFIQRHYALLPGYQPWPKYTFSKGEYAALSDVYGVHIANNYKQLECPLLGVPSPTCTATASLVARPNSFWTSNGVNNQVYDVQVSNTGDKAVTFLAISISTGSASITQQWNLNPVSANVYSLPSWYQGFQVDGSSSDAGFILSGAGSLSPTVSIQTIVC